MGVEHTFYDYINESGVNTISDWLNSIPKSVKVKFNNWLGHLEGINQGSWKRPLVETLTEGECDGLFEVRAKLSRQQFRIIGYHGPGVGTPTLLWGFIKSGSRVSQADCRIAHNRRLIVESNPNKYRGEHNYG